MKIPSYRPRRRLQNLRQLKRENRTLKRMIQLGQRLGAQHSLDSLFPLIMNGISDLMHVDRSSLFLVDMERNVLWTKYAQGLEGDPIRIDLKMGLAGSCLLSRKLINVTNAYDSPFFNAEIDNITGYRSESLLCVPLFSPNHEVRGVLELLNKDTGIFTVTDEQIAQEGAWQLEGLDIASPAGQTQARRLLEELRQKISFDRYGVFCLDQARSSICSVLVDQLEIKAIELSLKLGIAGLTAVTGVPQIITNAYRDSRFDSSVDSQTGYHTRNLLCVPLKNYQGEILGVLEVINKTAGTFNQSDLELLEKIASYLAVFVDHSLILDQHARQFDSMLEVLAASIDAKDPLTAGHSQRVCDYAVQIAAELGFDHHEQDVVRIAALLHDYGKVGVEDRILKKEGRLDEDEYRQIQLHVNYTQTILGKMAFMRKYKNVPLIAAAHHERLDGTGYSAGLAGFQIPYAARIIAVADVYEALTARRHYREALSGETALNMIEAEAGSKFDPHVVEALKRCLQSGRIAAGKPNTTC